MPKSKRQSILYWSLMAALLLVCATLAALEYRWIDQVSIAARERLQADLQANLRSLSRDFNTQISSAAERLTPLGRFSDPASVEREISSRFLAAKSARTSMFRVVALAEPARDGVELRSLDLRSAAFRNAPWPSDWSMLRERLTARLEPHQPGNRGPGGFGGPHFEDGAPTLIEPVWRADVSPSGPRELAWIIFELDTTYLKNVALPAAIQRHLQPNGGADYQVEVVDARDTSKIIYPEPSRAADLTKVFDASIGLLAIGQGHGPDRGHQPPASRAAGPPPSRAAMPPGPGEPPPDFGRWRMYVRSSAGSLEALVTRARWLNIVVMSGVLLLLLATIGALILFTRRAQRLAELQMEFVAGVSHELRTPLAVIHTAAYNLRGNVAAQPKQVERYGALIQQESGRLKELVEQILQFAGAGAGRLVRERRPVSVPQVIEEASRSVHTMVEQRGCIVEQNVDPKLPAVLGDSTALKQAIANLLSNAAKYGCGENRWIGVSAAKSRENDRDVVEIRVRDHGPGIPEDERAQIFEPFFRGRSAVRDQVHGTGLGLNLVKRVIEAHHGTIRVSSEASEGTEFIVSLPAAEPEESNATVVG